MQSTRYSDDVTLARVFVPTLRNDWDRQLLKFFLAFFFEGTVGAVGMRYFATPFVFAIGLTACTVGIYGMSLTIVLNCLRARKLFTAHKRRLMLRAQA